MGCTTIIEQPFDHMPVEVATEMLCAPKARMTNRERKECFRARERHFVSTLVAKPAEAKRSRFISSRNFSQLLTLQRRGNAKRAELERGFSLLTRQLDKVRRSDMPQPVADTLAAAIVQKQQQFNIAFDHYSMQAAYAKAEITRRITPREVVNEPLN